MRARAGYSLLLAVVITSAVLTSASALAGIVLSEIRQTREITTAIQAQVAAESDVEQALSELRKNDTLPSGGNTPFVSGITVERVVTEEAPLQPYRIAENDFVTLSVPAVPNPTISIAPWDADPECAARSWIEISRISWNGSDFDTFRQPFSRNEGVDSFAVPAGTIELRIRALYCDITALSVVNFPTRVVIRSTAEVQGIRQSAEVAVPRAAPAAGLFDFVIFSECELVKGVSIEASSCP